MLIAHQRPTHCVPVRSSGVVLEIKIDILLLPDSDCRANGGMVAGIYWVVWKACAEI